MNSLELFWISAFALGAWTFICGHCIQYSDFQLLVTELNYGKDSTEAKRALLQLRWTIVGCGLLLFLLFFITFFFGIKAFL